MSVFAMPECCSKKTWYGQHRPDGQGGWIQKPGWKDDPTTQAALDAATARAQWWVDQAEGRRIEKRMKQVAEATDLLCEYAPLAVKRLFVLMDGAGNEETRRKAANDILDRADDATASKAVVSEKGEHEQRVSFDLAGLPLEVLRALAEPGPGGEAEAGSTD